MLQASSMTDIVIKSDQENAINYVVDDVCVARTGAKTIKKNSPVGVTGSNGIIERAVQAAEGQPRTMKDMLGARYKQVIRSS